MYFLNFSPIRTEHLQNFIKKYEKRRTKCKLIDVCLTRWISKIDGLDVFEELLAYVVETLEYFSVNPESTINRGPSFADSYLKFQFRCLSSNHSKSF